MLSTPLAWRLARRLESAWTEPEPDDGESRWNRLERAWIELSRHRQRLSLARSHRLRFAWESARAELSQAAREFHRAYSEARMDFDSETKPPPPAREFFHDLRQLEAEFESVEILWKEKTLRAETEPIELLDVPLGRFAVAFNWERRTEPAVAFEIIPLDPNPAAGNREVTHPHVRDGHLCAGDAAGPLRKALWEGRIADAFVLIRAVLRTYNRSSAYVQLAEWSGSPCSDCGRRVDADERYPCQECEDDLCNDCSRSCSACETTRCADCLDACTLCQSDNCAGCLSADETGRSLCPDCWIRCDDCSKRTPRDRLSDGLCSPCRSLDEDSSDEGDEDLESADEPALEAAERTV